MINYTSQYTRRKARQDVSSQVKDQNLCSHSVVNTQKHWAFPVVSLTNSNSHGSRTQSSVRGIPAREGGRMKEVVVIGGPLYAEQQVWEGRSEHTGLGKQEAGTSSNTGAILNDRDAGHWGWRICNDKTRLAGLINIPCGRRVIKWITFPLHLEPSRALPVATASIAPATSKNASGLDIAQCRRELVSYDLCNVSHGFWAHALPLSAGQFSTSAVKYMAVLSP